MTKVSCDQANTNESGDDANDLVQFVSHPLELLPRKSGKGTRDREESSRLVLNVMIEIEPGPSGNTPIESGYHEIDSVLHRILVKKNKVRIQSTRTSR
jgi:hypothetical protein